MEQQRLNEVFTREKLGDSIIFHDLEQTSSRLWLENALLRFDEILRNNFDKKIDVFGENILEEICLRLEAIGGVFYIVQDQKEILATAGYACTIESMNQSRFKFGEGIVGQVVKSQKSRYIPNCPYQSLAIGSSLGNIQTQALICIPLLFNDEVYGALELISLDLFEEKHQLFLARIAKSLGAYLQLMVNNVRLQQMRDTIHDENHQKTVLRSKILELEATKKELEVQKLVLENYHRRINRSINYAKSIQNTILPSQRQQTSLFPHSFVIYLPKDIVSGDFYWFSAHEEGKIVAAIDCTGHGVPGAFMSLVGHNILNEAIQVNSLRSPGEIIAYLNQGIRKKLNQKEGLNNDGMDLGLVYVKPIDSDTFEVQYSGAKNQMLVAEKHKVSILKSDRKILGGRNSQDNMTFSTITKNLKKGDRLYLYTDGIIDQPNPKRKAFSNKLLKDVIWKSMGLSIQEQQEVITQAFHRHKAGADLRDDVTCIGVEL